MGEVFERGVVISGIGITDIGRSTGRAGIDMTEVSSRAAIADAGLRPVDVDGIATMGDTPVQEAAARLGVDARWANGGGPIRGALLKPVMDSIHAVATGQARHVLVYRTVNMAGGTMAPRGSGGDGGDDDEQSAVGGMGDMAPLLAHHAYSAANWLAMHARRHMELYGTKKEHLGWQAINSRHHAAMNPRAVYREPITMDDYLAARPISDPFGLYDCDVPIDGSIAVVVSHPDHAADCLQPPVHVHALGGADGKGGWYLRDDYPRMASTDAARQMWGRTDLRPADVDVAEVYDGFTFLALAWLEALGFCGEGESGPFVEGGARTRIGGELPVNTYGGQLSAGRMHGYWVLHEACVQLRGEADERQVAGAEVAVVSNGGGPLAGCMLLSR